MTLPRTLRGGLSNLTELNARLIAQAVTETEAEEEATEESVLGFGPTGAPEDPDADDDDGAAARAEVRGRFSTEDPFGFRRLTEFIEDTYFGGSGAGKASLIGAFVNEWAEEVAGPGPQFPGDIVDRLLGSEEFQAGAEWLPVRPQLDRMPAHFRTELENEDGQMTAVVVTNDPLRGPQFVEEHTVEDVVAAHMPNYRVPSPVAPVGPRISGIVPEGGTPGGGTRLPDAVVGAETGEVGPTGRATPAARGRFVSELVEDSRAAIPFISGEDFAKALAPEPSGGGRGGGGGGGTRRAIEFDKAHLTSQVADLYNRWMLEPGEAPESIVNGIVNRYIREARSLWSGKGVKKDFDTFVRGELKKLPRYETIYEHKLPDQSEEEFIGSFRQPIAGLGLRGEVTQRQTEAAVTSGGGPADQFRRVSRSREAQVANAGNLSQRMAKTLAGIGVG